MTTTILGTAICSAQTWFHAKKGYLTHRAVCSPCEKRLVYPHSYVLSMRKKASLLIELCAFHAKKASLPIELCALHVKKWLAYPLSYVLKEG